MNNRDFTFLENLFLETNCNLNLALQISDPGKAATFVDQLSHRVPGLQLIFIDKKVTTAPINQPSLIPETIISVDDGITWLLTQPQSHYLSSLYYNNNLILLRSNHMAIDGRALMQLVSSLGKDVPGIISPMLKSFPELFPNKLETPWFKGKHVLLLQPKTIDESQPKRGQSVFFSLPFEKIVTFNPETSRIHQMTGLLWTAALVSVSKFNGSIPQGTGIFTAVNFRNFLSDKMIDWNIGTLSDDVLTETKSPISQSTKLSSIVSDFQDTLKNPINHEQNPDEKSQDGITIEVSNIGVFELPPDVDDLQLTLTADGLLGEAFVTLIGYSVQSKRHSSFKCQLHYDPLYLAANEAESLLNFMKISLQKNSLEKTFEESLLSLE